MSKLLDDVKQLGQPGISVVCDFCTGSPISGHLNGCPILTVPRLVALVEAAERIVQLSNTAVVYMAGGKLRRCRFCQKGIWDSETQSYVMPIVHAIDCPWQALVAALGDDANETMAARLAGEDET